MNSLSKSFTVTSIVFPLTIETGSEILSDETTPSVIVNNLCILNEIQSLVITLTASKAATLSKLKSAAVKLALTSILGTKFFIVNKTLLSLTLRAILTSFCAVHIHSGPPILVISISVFLRSEVPKIFDWLSNNHCSLPWKNSTPCFKVLSFKSAKSDDSISIDDLISTIASPPGVSLGVSLCVSSLNPVISKLNFILVESLLFS